MRPQLAAARRITTFDEVVCFGCDNCYGVCPDNAVVKLADGS
jgi:NAD-dependent dihydropyrimidine dehydrogenase PreA subunit